ncbi:MAG: hypothetical protein ACPG19_13395 [Saprospiraceae bacterium]
MKIVLITLVIGMFICIFALNFYFRMRVFKAYKYLVQNEIEFNTTDIFSKKKIEEIVIRYPKHADGIHDFMDNIRRSVQLATVFTTLITAFAAILMFME